LRIRFYLARPYLLVGQLQTSAMYI